MDIPHNASRLHDVFAVGAPALSAALYIATDKAVFVRSRLGIEPGAGFGPWGSLGNPGARGIAAQVLLGGAHRVFALDDQGTLKLSSSSGDPGNEGSSFSAWETLPTSTKFADLHAAYLSDGTPLIFAIDEDGALWNSTDGSTWNSLGADGVLGQLVAIAAGSHRNVTFAGLEPMLVGVSSSGSVYAAPFPWNRWSLIP